MARALVKYVHTQWVRFRKISVQWGRARVCTSVLFSFHPNFKYQESV